MDTKNKDNRDRGVQFDDSTFGSGLCNINNNEAGVGYMSSTTIKNEDKNSIKLLTPSLTRYGVLMLAAAGISVVGSEVLAGAFDLGVGVEAATNPFKTAFTTHWGKAVGIAAAATTMVSPGDPRARMTNGAMVAVGGSMACLGIIALFFGA